ncbi:MAG: ATP-dependent DNA helicase [Clostridia bacterium]
MDEIFHVSVRELVAFSFFPSDIMPATDMSALHAGTAAHKARQVQQAGKAECPVKHLFSLHGENVLVYGRMDAFTDGEIPYVEEIKHSAWEDTATVAAYRAQALCYAAMVAFEKPCASVCFCLAFVDSKGEIIHEIPQTMSAEALLCEMEALLMPYVAFAIREREHRRRRDESLKALPFPFESYRRGQRELAAQVYTAISRKKRLFASLPTGTGKSAAVLYPALKAMGEGKTKKLLYLTARSTARQSPIQALERMSKQGMKARCTMLSAKEKLCPKPTRCHPSHCPRAKGHFLRQGEGIAELLNADAFCWTDDLIIQTAERHMLCPFELALAMTELADVVLMDLNYAFDPFAQCKRLLQHTRNTTLLIDEAHHVVDRVRDSLSGEMDSRELVSMRVSFGKEMGRRHPYYRALTELIHALRGLAPQAEGEEEEHEKMLLALPPEIAPLVQALANEALALMAQPLPNEQIMMEVSAVLRLCFPFLYAVEHLDEDYGILWSAHGRERGLLLYCLLPAKEIARITKPMRGTVFFSATLTPLIAMKQLLGGAEEDACFSLPSPFPPEHLAVVRKRISTKFAMREQSAPAVAKSIAEAVQAKQGKYIAYFPSYAYMHLVLMHLDEHTLPPLWVQEREMDEKARAAFFAAFDEEPAPKLGLCVLGGLFSEGVDLPGDKLIGVIVVGVGLPTPSARLRAIQACYEKHFGDGFHYACRIPALHKVLQAGGRVIRSQNDRGLVLLIDERYYQRGYEALLPAEWRLQNENIALAMKRLEEEA